MRTQFMDMHSGGSLKEDKQYIYIEAPEEEAKVIFYNIYGHNPERVTCTCCGNDYSISEEDDLLQISAYERNCKYDDKQKKYIEAQSSNLVRHKDYIPIEEYLKSEDAVFYFKEDILPEWREGDVPSQGYVRMP